MDPTLVTGIIAGAVAIFTAVIGIVFGYRGRKDEDSQLGAYRSLDEWRRSETDRANRAELARDREALRADRAEDALDNPRNSRH